MLNQLPNNRSLQLLTDQFNWSQARKELLWTQVVVSKIKNQIQVIEGLAGDASLLAFELNRLEVNDSSNREAVVARKYFPLLFDKLKFTRHNAETPINAALNYGYSILLATVNRKIVSDGYLTYLGIHHHSDDNAFNLGSDLMEPFRPLVDLWVAHQQFNALTPQIKYGLVALLNVEITFNGKRTLLMNAIDHYVHNCLNYLTTGEHLVGCEVEFVDEVSNHALNCNV